MDRDLIAELLEQSSTPRRGGSWHAVKQIEHYRLSLNITQENIPPYRWLVTARLISDKNDLPEGLAEEEFLSYIDAYSCWESLVLKHNMKDIKQILWGQ